MVYNEGQLGFLFPSQDITSEFSLILKDVLVDRGSKYTAFAFLVGEEVEVKQKIRELKKDPYFQKATHNSYAYRLQTPTGILAGKNDDGEQGAGMCILRELERAGRVNILVGVTRYFGGIQLHGDRFKNVIETTKKLLQEL